MKAEHLTTLSNNSYLRDYGDILPETQAHFAPYARNTGAKKVPIAKTPFEIHVTMADDGTAAFTLYKGVAPVSTNYCCFRAYDTEAVFSAFKKEVKGYCKEARIPMPLLRQPESHRWLYSHPVLFRGTTPADFQLAGEIEFYIYHALHMAAHPEDFK